LYFESFSQLSLKALRFTAKICHLDLNTEQINKINEAKLNLDPFSDTIKGLKGVKKKVEDKGTIISILSNGEATKTEKLLSNVGLRQYFDYIISAEDVKKYKPSPEPYSLASKRIGIPISDICLVSSNLWDIAGGLAVGMQTCWINRGEDVKASEEVEHYKESLLLNDSLAILKSHAMSEEDMVIRKYILQLLCQGCINLDDKLIEILSMKAKYELVIMEEEGLLKIKKKHLFVTEAGKTFIRNIAMVFDQKLREFKPQTENVFSKAI
jgi:2-haloalkanoic acid dehalogenase type II